ncbi:BCCT family transporter [Paracoccus seriniphilus]|uniref:BCCT family transporter n=1 Tax=Paracoccus seriniphilus TaxID=184748 RepID=UPI00356565B1
MSSARRDISPPLTELPIRTANRGFYDGFSPDVTVTAKILVGALIIWAIAFPEHAGTVLNAIKEVILTNFAAWYIYIMTFFVIFCIGLAILPASGRLKIGRDEDEPEFSRFSWFSMMFGAGIGVGMLTWAVAEPVYHFNNNPEVIQNLANSGGRDNLLNAFKWSYLDWGFSAWATYAVAGLGIGFFAYRRGLPLTVRSALTPLFGSRLSGWPGHAIDVFAVIATVLGVAQTIGLGVEQFVAGMSRIGMGDWLLNSGGTASVAGVVLGLVIIMTASTMSALSGVGRGIKWLSNLNMTLSIVLLSFFLVFGSTAMGLHALFLGMWDYVRALPEMLFTVYRADGAGGVADQLAKWQDAWPVFYWAWWISFAPFVGLFLARISRGRTIREFMLGAVLVPALMCFVWFAFAGGTAIDLELNGGAAGLIFAASDGDKIFAITNFLLGDVMGWLMAVLIVVLLMTFLVTTADSAVLIVNTINAAGNEGPKARRHILFWGVALGLVVGALLLVGGLQAIQTAIVIGALPFSVVMVLICAALVKAIMRDSLRASRGLPTTYADNDGAALSATLPE